MATISPTGELSAITHRPRLESRVALVTGASSGLGRAIALTFASHGAALVVCADLQPGPKPGTDGASTEDTHDAICRLYGSGKALFVKTDVGDSGNVRHAVAEAVRIGGRLDVIVNNAGLGTDDPTIRIHQHNDDRWDLMMRVNVRGVYLGCKYACEQFLKQQPDAQGHRGWIVNIASMLGLVGKAGGDGEAALELDERMAWQRTDETVAAYCASKGAVVNLTRQIAIDYGRDRIHCNALCPGFTKTSMTRGMFEDGESYSMMKSTTPWADLGEAMDVAKAALTLATDDAAWITGVALPVDGGYTAR